MYVCVCHAIRCRDLEEASGRGIRHAREVHDHFGVRPQCGRCLPTIRRMLRGGDRPSADGEE